MAGLVPATHAEPGPASDSMDWAFIGPNAQAIIAGFPRFALQRILWLTVWRGGASRGPSTAALLMSGPRVSALPSFGLVVIARQGLPGVLSSFRFGVYALSWTSEVNFGSHAV